MQKAESVVKATICSAIDNRVYKVYLVYTGCVARNHALWAVRILYPVGDSFRQQDILKLI